MVRLAKFIAQNGYCSRRRAEELIELGEVRVNDSVARITTPVDPKRDEVTVCGQRIRPEKKLYLALNKPPGYLSTCKPGKEKGKTVLDLIDVPERVYPVGRLDRDSCGLLILTNDGSLAYSLTHPSGETEKEYLVETSEPFSEIDENKLTAGMVLGGRVCRFHRLSRLEGAKYRIILKQGLNRQIRRMTEAVGKRVIKLKRLRVGELLLADLPEGRWRRLTQNEIKKLKRRKK